MPKLSKKTAMIPESDTDVELLSESEVEVEQKVVQKKTKKATKKPVKIVESTAEESGDEEKEEKKTAANGYVKYSTKKMRQCVETVQAVLAREEYAGVVVSEMKSNDFKALAEVLMAEHKKLFDEKIEHRHERKLQREYMAKLVSQKPVVLDDDTDPMFYEAYSIAELQAYADQKGVKYPGRVSKAKLAEYLTGKDEYVDLEADLDVTDLEAVLKLINFSLHKPLSIRKKAYISKFGLTFEPREREQSVTEKLVKYLSEQFGDEFSEDMLKSKSD